MWKGQNVGFPKTDKVYIGIFNNKNRLQGAGNCGKIYTEIISKRKEENMKKIALFSLIMCLGVMNADAASQCKTSITFKAGNNNWNAGSDEYLFENERDYMNAVNTGWYYECDNSDCPDNSYVEVKSKHVFKGKTIHQSAKYKCSLNWSNDKWVEVNDVKGLTKCTNKKRWNSDWGVDKLLQNAEADEYLFPTVEDYNALKSLNYVQVYECDSSVCSDGKILTLPAGHFFKRTKINKQRKYKCVLGEGLGLGLVGDDRWVDITDDCGEDCGDKPKTCEQLYSGAEAIACCKQEGKDKWDSKNKTCKCKDPKKWNHSKKQCEKQDGGDVTPPTPPQPNKTCEQLYKGNQAAIDCCNAGEKWNKQTNSCDCRDASKVWDATKKQCITKPDEPVEPIVDGDCIYTFDVSITCSNGNYYHESGSRPVKMSQLNGMDCKTFNETYGADVNKWQELFGKLCKDSGGNTQIVQHGPSQDEINRAQKKLEAFTSSAKDEASVWKTAEGKFNTTRLATDLTAGVVLGTVGGVVTGVVIKKNQVKKGFEALHCTVGGQKVADWGDEFSVGLNR